MKIARLKKNGKEIYAKYADGVYTKIAGDVFGEYQSTDELISGDFEVLAPVMPSKIIALGVNYKGHASEVGMDVKTEPLLFLIPPSALLNHGGEIIIANKENRTDFEAELAIVIKKKCKNINSDEAKEYILGYSCANDVSDRVLQKRDGQWLRAKGFDTYCPLGPHIVTDISPENLSVQSFLNGELRQNSNTKNMITGVYEALSFISKIMTLLPGDVIMTGTPEGIGEMKSGDEIEIRIEGIGSLVNKVL